MGNFNKNREINLKEYIPDVLSDVDEYKAIIELETKSKKRQWQTLEDMFDSQYILEAGEFGISLFEKMHGIKPLDTDSLDFRRNRLYQLYNSSSPFTRRWLETSLKSMLHGVDFHYELNTEKFGFLLTFEGITMPVFNQVTQWLDRILPCNMTITYLYKMNDENRHFYGLIPVKIGHKHIRLDFPSGHSQNAFIGNANIMAGRKEIKLNRIDGFYCNGYTGAVHRLTGYKTIGGQR